MPPINVKDNVKIEFEESELTKKQVECKIIDYDREKIVRGLIRACEKRPITYAQMEDIADKIESELYHMMSKEVTSTEIGEKVMSHLKELDEVAYVRFASVHKRFSNIQSFMETLKELLDEK